MEPQLQPVKGRGPRDKPQPLSSQANPPRLTFWDKAVIVLLLGAVIGVGGSRVYYERRLEESIKLQRFVHKNVVYEIRESKPLTSQ